MGIRSFEYWLAERGHVKEAPLAALVGTRVGIDFTSYLRQLLAQARPDSLDSFGAAVGGAPLSLTGQIEKDLKSLEKAGVKPVFVFPGLAPRERERPFANDDGTAWRRGQAWEHYEQGRVPQATLEFGQAQPVLAHDVLRVVHRLFKQRSVEFVVAPYLAWAQLVYLQRHDKAYVHSLYGPNELFLFEGIDRVILNIDFASSTISFASKSAVLADLALSYDQFLDVAILAGYEGSPTFPGLEHRGDFVFRSVVDLVKSRGSGMGVVLSFPPVFSTTYLDAFARARCMIKFSLVLVAPEGRILPLPLALPPPPSSNSSALTTADIPVDLHDIFSPRFPDEVYYQLFRGLLGTQFISALATGHLIEPVPLCGSTPEYERFVKGLTEAPNSARCVAIALISSVLHPMWSKKTASAIYYFDPMREHPIAHSHSLTLAFIEGVSKWNVDARHVENELRRQASSTIDLSLCLGATCTPSHATSTITPKILEKPLDKKDEIVANTLWRFLELRSFLSASHQHTPHAVALYAAMRASKVNDKFQEPLILTIELLRAGVLHNGRIGGRAWSGGPNFQGSEDDKRCMLLVMRVMSIVPMSFHPIPWTGPLSRELLVFNSFVRVLSRSLRGLLESISVNLLLRSDARRSREDYLDIALSLPFQSDVNTGLGILFKAFGDAVCHMAGGIEVVKASGTDGDDKEKVDEAKIVTLGLLEEAFPNVKDVSKELKRGIRFWEIVMLAVRTLESNSLVKGEQRSIATELVAQFEAADLWLKPFGSI